RDPRVARRPAGPDVRPRPRASAHPRVLRAHEPLQALAHPRVATRDALAPPPVGRGGLRPAHELLTRGVAEPLGQAAIPSNIEEAQRGMVSTIDTIDFDGDDELDIRGVIRPSADCA